MLGYGFLYARYHLRHGRTPNYGIYYDPQTWKDYLLHRVPEAQRDSLEKEYDTWSDKIQRVMEFYELCVQPFMEQVASGILNTMDKVRDCTDKIMHVMVLTMVAIIMDLI